MNPSIQAFYHRDSIQEDVDVEASSRFGESDSCRKEVGALSDPLERKFNPTQEYEPYDIGSLVPGPAAVTFVGRIVNFNVHHGRSKAQQAAKGWHHLIVKDDTGAVCVTLYFAHQPYQLSLGLLVFIWTPFISGTVKNESFLVPDAPVATNIFPGRDPRVHLVIHQLGDSGISCRQPLHHHKSQPLSNLVTLRSYLDGAYELLDTRILVCVKSVGAKRKITTKKGASIELQEVYVFDDTAESVLKLWNEVTTSTKAWKVGRTLLLITRPVFKHGYGEGNVAVNHASMVDIDPDCPEADWLRNYGATMTKKQSIDPTFPDGLWDVAAFLAGSERALFTIADVDDFVRSDPAQTFMGFLSLTIMEMNLVRNHQRNMLLCQECCGLPIYANCLQAKCKNCDNDIELGLNPRIVGTLIDETGCVTAGKLLWSHTAWEELLGRSVDVLESSSRRDLSSLEQRLLFTRVSVVFGWAEQVGRLVILAVMQ